MLGAVGEQSLAGKAAIVTGAASGIGRATAELFAGEGVAVVAVDVDPAGASVVETIESAGGLARFIEADVTRRIDCGAVVEAARGAYGGVDFLVNNAGITRRATILETSEADWDRIMEVNVKAIYLLSRAAIPLMIERGGGSIINTASGWGLAAGPRAAAYCASKGAVVQLTKAMAIDHATDRIRVNCVCPGDVDTPMLESEAEELGAPQAEFLAAAAARPMRRLGSPQEIAAAILYLAASESAFVTGAALVIDGGGLLG